MRVGSDLDAFTAELDKVELRVRAVVAAGRGSFFEGSESYDRASMAIIRLAALFENEKRFARFLSAATAIERQGISHTRNVAGHAGYIAMDDEIFWRTVTVQVPQFIAKLRHVNAI
ncbi:antitoxin [Microbacterium sp. NPDC089987]|uniref:antitoxin n=1 Tax=Microbacterium sp. NPDC089987 TaxID=3364202 RepID=UPI003817AA65